MKFGYTILYVKDVKATVDFYERAFDLKKKMIHEDQYAELDTGETTLSFASFEMAEQNGLSLQPVKSTKPLDSFTIQGPDFKGPLANVNIGLVTENIEAAFEQAINHGAIKIKPPEKRPWGQCAYVKDLNGFLVEIFTPLQAHSASYEFSYQSVWSVKKIIQHKVTKYRVVPKNKVIEIPSIKWPDKFKIVLKRATETKKPIFLNV